MHSAVQRTQDRVPAPESLQSDIRQKDAMGMSVEMEQGHRGTMCSRPIFNHSHAVYNLRDLGGKEVTLALLIWKKWPHKYWEGEQHAEEANSER